MLRRAGRAAQDTAETDDAAARAKAIAEDTGRIEPPPPRFPLSKTFGGAILLGSIVMWGLFRAQVRGMHEVVVTPEHCYEYHLMKSGRRSECTARGYTIVEDSEGCMAAAQQLGRTQAEPFLSKPNHCHKRPHGCYYSLSKAVVFYNNCQGNANPSDPSRRIICQGSPLYNTDKCAYTEKHHLSLSPVDLLYTLFMTPFVYGLGRLLAACPSSRASTDGGGGGCSGCGGSGCGGGGGG
eukprot:Hpha_TRINITY_DN17111_c0_g1::TRINITY_DN17111_c0_g1_i1::g.146850::m.146850